MKKRSNGGVKTSNSNLQAKLDQWAQAVQSAVMHPHPSPIRSQAIAEFCKTFVPTDVSEDDISYFTNNLDTDQVIACLCIDLPRVFNNDVYSILFILGILSINGSGIVTMCFRTKRRENRGRSIE